MPRQARLVIPDYPHHIILRGNNRSAIFNKDEDRSFFIKCLQEAKEKTKSKIYGYCLMSNHVHLIIVPSIEGGLGNMIQSLGRRYVQYINQVYKRTGTLWEGRFKSSLISNDEYLFACCIYIESNPVRAKIVKDAGGYPWSSFRAKTEGEKDFLIDADPVYSSLGKTDKERQLNYKNCFIKEVAPEKIDFIRYVTQRGGVMGEAISVKKISNIVGHSIVLRQRGRPRKSL